MEYHVTLYPEKDRFEIESDGHTAYLEYKLKHGSLAILHTIVPSALQGGGIGAALVKAAFEYARKEQLKVIPTCYFARIWVERHPDYSDLLP